MRESLPRPPPFRSPCACQGGYRADVGKPDTARSTGFLQPAPGVGPAPVPLPVPADRLRSVLGIREVNFVQGKEVLATIDQSLASSS